MATNFFCCSYHEFLRPWSAWCRPGPVLLEAAQLWILDVLGAWFGKDLKSIRLPDHWSQLLWRKIFLHFVEPVRFSKSYRLRLHKFYSQSDSPPNIQICQPHVSYDDVAPNSATHNDPPIVMYVAPFAVGWVLFTNSTHSSRVLVKPIFSLVLFKPAP